MLLFFFLLLSNSCSEDVSSVDTSGDPSNLTIEVTISEDGTGKVEIIAHADNTVEYQFDMAEFSDIDPETNTDGYLEYTYSTSGFYEVEVKAFGSSGRFLRKTKQIIVQVGSSGEPVNNGQGYTTPLSYEGYTLIWQDEFSGTSLNTSNWSYEIGDGCPNLCGWGNNELEYYRAENSWVDQGVMTIEARKENFQNKEYTSARIKSQNKFFFKYGRVDIRAVLPKGKGLWPALWMLGNNITSASWPNCGEIDIMELIGHLPDIVHGTIHWDNGGTYASTGGNTALSSGTFADEYHVFSVVWDTESIKWFLDDNLYKEADITHSNLSEFHQQFFLIFNVAVGGNWPGIPNSLTVFPQQMKVDYVRVFQEN